MLEKVNPDLQKERDAATIDIEELACFIYNGPEELEKKRKLGSLFKFLWLVKLIN